MTDVERLQAELKTERIAAVVSARRTLDADAVTALVFERSDPEGANAEETLHALLEQKPHLGEPPRPPHVSTSSATNPARSRRLVVNEAAEDLALRPAERARRRIVRGYEKSLRGGV